MRRVDHRVDGVHVLRDPLRDLADAEVARRSEAEEVRRDAHAERLQPLGGVVDELGDHPAGRRRRLVRVDDRVDVAVGGEAHVVELDLVEAGAGGDLGDRDVVVPDALVVRVRPTEACVVVPDGAVRVLDCELGTAGREARVLEDDDAADQVDALCVNLAGGLARLVVRLCGADLARERHPRGDKADLAVLVLHVQLDRVQPVVDELEVLLELPVERGERHRHVDPAHLLRELPGRLHG